ALLLLSSDCGALRALPSFPTRRSSDLPHPVLDLGTAWIGGRGRHRVVLLFLPRSRPRNADAPRPRHQPGGRHRPDDRPGAPAARSEEHTSELQSREKLVCRLLLEKKKK